MEGREEERRSIRALLDEARTGHAGILGFRGAAGTGKTTLCDDALVAATDMTVLSLCGVESERDLPLAALLALLRPLDEFVDDLPGAQRAVAGALLEGVGSQVGDSFALGATCLALLAVAAEKEPLLVIVDDLQWVDEVSGRAMAFAFRRLARDAVAVLLASRETEPDDGRPDPLPGPWPWTELGGLDADQCTRLLGANGVAPAVADRLCVLCAGNPLALLEVADGLTVAQRLGTVPLPDPVPLGPRGTAAIGRRLAGLPADCVEALVVLAVGGDADLPDHARALSARGTEPTVLVAAERAGVVRVDSGLPRFAHPLLRSAVISLANPAMRRRAHAAWAELDGVPVGRRARHLAAATVGASEEVAAALEEAADVAAERGGVAAGVDALVQAALVSPEPSARARRRLRAAEGAFLAGRRELAQELVSSVLAEEAPTLDPAPAGLRDQALALDASLRVWTTEVGDARAVVTPVIDRLAGPAPELAALLGVQLVITMWSAGETRARIDLCHRIRALAIEDPALRHLVEFTDATFSLANCDPGPTREMLCGGDPASWRDELLRRYPAYYTGLHHWWRWTDRIDQGRFEIEAHIADARRRMATTLLPHPLMLRADIHFETGEIARSRADLTEAIGLCEETGQDGLLGYAHALRGKAAALEGDESLARTEAELALEIARRSGLRPITFFAHHTLGLLELGLGRPGEAARHLAFLRTTALDLGSHHPKSVPWHADHVEALLGAGRRDEAAVVSAELAADAERCDSAWARAVALGTEARVAPDDQADGKLEQAIDAQEGMPLEQARTRLFLGEHRRRHGRVRDARDPLAAAAATFAGAGVLPWARRADAELRAAGGRAATTPAPDLGGLTDRELQICLAVADGATNKEVGAALFLSRKTVEYHLGNAFRKLGVTSRAQLVRLVAAR
ncbi:LuxR family transcriptional regulator [Actinomycetospora endophytica]|uniref:LuxR family transcriptional regulator n=1 Tax=Actinomycetospora endophytica TaxID=2291215 RepID=A0ABS8PAT0_9PSEU|nr:LuxR family transcriptional regulator [Actinomycetospora endophytica]MCD2195037.1 LuxR family transcriptional regulator [Actinomycetospora endophytica]